jgi:hypothetical protein
MSGLDFDALSDSQKRQLNLMPAMLYHGVKSESADVSLEPSKLIAELKRSSTRWSI